MADDEVKFTKISLSGSSDGVRFLSLGVACSALATHVTCCAQEGGLFKIGKVRVPSRGCGARASLPALANATGL